MRRRRVAGAALTVAMLAAMPMQVALCVKPYREQIRGVDRVVGTPYVIPPGEGCSFAVGFEFEHQGIHWQFSDGREVANNNAAQTFTNLETGTSYVHRSNYHLTDTISTDGGTIFEVIDGNFFYGPYPGDQGPEGEVGPAGALYALTGHSSLTYDVEAGVITAFESRGRAIDICQILSA